MSVILSDWNLHTARNQFDFLHSTVVHHIDRKSSTNNILHFDSVIVALFVIQQILQWFRCFWLPLRHIIQVRFLPQQNLVASRHEWHIYEHIVIKSDSHQIAYKLEIQVGLVRLPIKPIELGVFIILKHRELQVKNLFHDQRKILFSNAANIDARLFFKSNPQRELQWVLPSNWQNFHYFL